MPSGSGRTYLLFFAYCFNVSEKIFSNTVNIENMFDFCIDKQMFGLYNDIRTKERTFDARRSE